MKNLNKAIEDMWFKIKGKISIGITEKHRVSSLGVILKMEKENGRVIWNRFSINSSLEGEYEKAQ